MEHAKDFLQSIPPDDTRVAQLTEGLVELARHSKWEVRKATADALCFGAAPMAADTLRLIVDDPVPFVRQAAEKSLREASRVTTKIYEKRDPTAERLFELIRKMNPRNIRESYAAALQVGQIYYRELAASTAHELRTSLFSLSGLIQELLEDAADNRSETAEAHAKINQAIGNLSKIIGGLSDLTRDPERDEVFNATPVVEQAMAEAVSAFRANGGSNVQLVMSRSSAGAKVKGDPSRLLQALRNLLLNAMEASPPERNVIISCNQPENMLVVSIKDEGAGMTEQQIEEAFKPFATLKRESGHTGMGIPIAQRIIHFDFGGELRFKSEVSVGTEAHVELPLYKGDQ